MELTTKELFDLAETHWAETNPMTAPWDRVSPMDQARQAEAIKAVIAEYEKIRVNDYLSTIPIKDSWGNWEDVPEGVRYYPTQRNHFLYVNRNGLRKVIDSDGAEITSVATDNTVQSWGPFRKVEQ